MDYRIEVLDFEVEIVGVKNSMENGRLHNKMIKSVIEVF